MGPDLLPCVWTVQALDLALAKDDRLAVGFFQRAAVLMQMSRCAPSRAGFVLQGWLLTFALLQAGGGSVRLHLGAEAHEGERGDRLQAAGAPLQALQLAGGTASSFGVKESRTSVPLFLPPSALSNLSPAHLHTPVG